MKIEQITLHGYLNLAQELVTLTREQQQINARKEEIVEVLNTARVIRDIDQELTDTEK